MHIDIHSYNITKTEQNNSSSTTKIELTISVNKEIKITSTIIERRGQHISSFVNEGYVTSDYNEKDKVIHSFNITERGIDKIKEYIYLNQSQFNSHTILFKAIRFYLNFRFINF